MEDSKLMTYREAADRLGLSHLTLRKFVSQRRIPYVKLGRAVRFSPIQLDKWISDRSLEAKPMGGRDEQ